MQEIDIKKTGHKIKEMCKVRNISVKDIQEKLLVGSFQAVYAWFSGKSLPSLDNLYRLSRLLNVSMDSLIVGQQEEHPGIMYVDNRYEIRIRYGGKRHSKSAKTLEEAKRIYDEWVKEVHGDFAK